MLDKFDNAWLGLGDTTHLEHANPLGDSDRDLVNLMRDRKYLALACKVLLNVQLLPDQAAILEELWTNPFSMYVASRGQGKSSLLAMFALLKMIFCPRIKLVIVGAAYRQSKIIFGYAEQIWNDSPILRSICDKNSGPRRDVDQCVMRINGSTATAIPIGDGSKIRGLRANIIIADEFNSLDRFIFETVIQGFTSVSASPLANVQEEARRQALKDAGLWTVDEEKQHQQRGGNQAIISGTAGYSFQSFAAYFERYRKIIVSRGEPNKLTEIFGDGEIPEVFDYRDYKVVRIPYELIPKGFMDDKQIMRAKATVHAGVFQNEYGCVFSTDSDGFFKRSLIEGCVAKETKPIALPSGDVWFDARIRGDQSRRYVYGIDPASEQDNFSIVVLQLHADHTRIVYCWSTNRKEFQARKRAGVIGENDFYGFCARKIRDLMKVFPCERIAIDGQGGGIAVCEALHDPDKCGDGEQLLWPVISDGKVQDSDDQPGLHILEVCQFAKADWTAAANHGLRKDFEDKILLFPQFDNISLALSAAQDEREGRASLYDSLEDCVMEIEELKNELACIVMTRTGMGINSRDRWDTPETKLASGRKGRLRKDRYSSLVMANMVARQMARQTPVVEFPVIGGATHELCHGAGGNDGVMYRGPEWFTKGGGFKGIGITRRAEEVQRSRSRYGR